MFGFDNGKWYLLVLGISMLYCMSLSYSQTSLCGHLYKGITCPKQLPFLGPLNQKSVQMNLY